MVNEVAMALLVSTGCEYILSGEESLEKWFKNNGVIFRNSSEYNRGYWIEFETEEELTQFTLSWL